MPLSVSPAPASGPVLSQKALEKGLINEDQAKVMSDKERTNLIFLPGFSTAEKVTDVSGRGVGMDVVKKNIEKLNGTIEIDSRPGIETRFRIKIPLTLAIIFILLYLTFRRISEAALVMLTLPFALVGGFWLLLILGYNLSVAVAVGFLALAGIAVNAAIVLISAGNQRLKTGMSVLHATIYAARRRVIPILITSLTTVAGLFSLEALRPGTGLAARDFYFFEGLLAFDGFAIGGVSVGEGTERMLDVVESAAPLLPEDKPRYVMGVGKPLEILEAVANLW